MTTAIDTGVLRQLALDLPRADVLLVVRTFESDMQRLGAALAAAGTVGDGDGWRRAAHGIAGAAGAVGAVVLERLARAAMALGAVDPMNGTGGGTGGDPRGDPRGDPNGDPTVDPGVAARDIAAFTTALGATLAELREFLADGTFHP